MRSLTGKQSLAASLALAATTLFYFYLTWHNEYADLLSDSSIYLLMASALDPSQQVPDRVFDVVMSDYHFPPLYPFVLWLFGGGADHPFTSHIVNTALVIAALVCFFLWLRAQSVEWAPGLMLVGVVAVLPVTSYFANFIVSEFLYMALSFLGLAALAHTGKGVRYCYAAAILVGLAVSTRFIGVALLPALAFIVFRTQRRQLLPVLAVAVCLPLLWSLYKTSFGSSNYVSSFFLSHQGDFLTSVLTYAQVNLQVMGLAWIKSFDHYISDYSTIPGVILGLLVLAGWVRRLVQGAGDAMYVLFYFLILVPWPHPHHIHRFLLPVLPILLFYAAVGIRLGTDRLVRPFAGKMVLYGALIAIVALTLPTNMILVTRLTTPVPEHLADVGRSQLWLFSRDPKAALRKMEFMYGLDRSMSSTNVVPEDQCIWSIEPARQMLISRRASFGTPGPAIDDSSFESAAEKCPYFFLVSAVPDPNLLGISAFYPVERIRDASQVVRTFEHGEFGVISVLMMQRRE